MYDWNDLRCFLAVARAGSTLAACKDLGVNQTTVARRISALEAALSVRLFERDPAGYRISEAGRALLPGAERMEREAEAVTKLAAQHKRQLTGIIRVTTSDILAGVVLTPALGDFAELYPDVQIHVLVDDRILDLTRGEADVALRAGAPSETELVGRRLVDANWGLYCSQTYAARRGVAGAHDLLESHAVLGFEGSLDRTPVAQWLNARAGEHAIVSRSNSLSNHVNLIRSGMGVGALPRVEGDRHSDLVLCHGNIDVPPQPIWLLWRPELGEMPRVRAFTDFLVARATALRGAFEGRSP